MMRYGSIGTWKGFPVYLMKRKDITAIDADCIMVDDFTGEMVLNGNVIAHLNLKDYSVKDNKEIYVYKNFINPYTAISSPTRGLEDECPHSFEKMTKQNEKSFEIPVEKVEDLEKVLDEAMHSNVICGIDFDKIVKESLNVEVV